MVEFSYLVFEFVEHEWCYVELAYGAGVPGYPVAHAGSVALEAVGVDVAGEGDVSGGVGAVFVE